MSGNRKDLAQEAAARAMKIRAQASFSLRSPINVFDLCERIGVSVFFQDIPSMEGIYMPDAVPRPAIIVSSLRPAGRKAITCGHELGHHAFGHGRQWDELIEERSQSRSFDPDEFQADVFSSILQMPRSAVSHALSQRHLDPERCRPEEIFALSTFFGVSYGAFITHLERTLNLIGMKRASELSSQKPKEIRASLLGELCPQELIVIDLAWQDRTADVEVGDSLILPAGAKVEGRCVKVISEDGNWTVAIASTPGIARAIHSSPWSTFIRVYRKNYVGRALFRFDEEVDDGD